MSIKEVHCHWNDKAPQPPPPFYHPEYRFQFALPRFEDASTVVDSLNKEGNKLFKNHEFYEAMWKYEYSRQIVSQTRGVQADIFNLLARACTNIALAGLKLLECTPANKQLYDYILSSCSRVIEGYPVPASNSLIQKAYYRRAECSRIYVEVASMDQDEKSNIKDRILKDYIQSHIRVWQERETTALVKAIILTVEYGKKSEHVELLKPRLELLCCSSNSFLKLVTDMLKVDSVKPKYLEFLLKHNDCEYHFKPSKAVSLFTTLIKKFSTNKNLVSLISQFQAYFEEDDILCEVYRKSQTDETVQNGLYQYFLKMYSSSPKLDLVAQSLNPVHRTKLLFHKVEKKKYEDADAVLKGGDIKPEEINLSGMIVALLDDLEDTQFLELLLKRGVAVKRSEEISPVTILLSRWKKSNSTQRKKIINNVVVLLKHGCEIKDLCSFYDGKQTTPVHVATELSILYGSTELLCITTSKYDSLDLVDEDKQTPIYTLTDKKFLEADKNVLKTVFELLIVTLKINVEHKDIHGKTVLDYLTCDDVRYKIMQELCPQISQDDKQDGVTVATIGTNIEKQQPHLQTYLPDKSTDVSKTKVEEDRFRDLSTCTENIDTLLAEKVQAIMKKENSYFSLSDSSSTQTDVTVASSSERTDSKAKYTKSAGKENKHEAKISKEHSQRYSQENGELAWEIVWADKVKKFLNKSRYQSHIVDKITEKVREIAMGGWNLDNRKPVSRKRAIYEARFSDAYRIIWGITTQLSERMTKEFYETMQKLSSDSSTQPPKIPVKSEMILVAAVVMDHDNIHHHVKVSERSLDTESKGRHLAKAKKTFDHESKKKYISYAKELFCAQSEEEYITIAESLFEAESKEEYVEIIDSKTFLPLYLENTKPKQRFPKWYIPKDSKTNEIVAKAAEQMGCHRLSGDLVTVEEDKQFSKLYSLKSQHVLSLLYGEYHRGDYPIVLSDEEYGIVAIPDNQAILLLGRSGTGKTTCCLCRIWNKFKEYWVESVEDRMENPGIPKIKTSVCTRMMYEVSDDGVNNEPLITCNPSSKDKVSCIDVSAAAVEVSGKDVTLECSNENATPSKLQETRESYNDSSYPSSPKEEYEHLHQVFLAKNYIFCEQMKERFYDFVAGDYSFNKIAENFMNFEYGDLPSSLLDIDSCAYPLFLPARKFFLILDKSLDDGQAFFKNKDTIPYYHDDEETLESLLDFELSDSEEVDETGQRKTKPQATQGTQKHYTEVTATYFATTLWPLLNKNCGDPKADPLLVWTEIQSYIKGSFEAVTSQKGYLSLNEYLEIGKKRAPYFVGSRLDVYKVFNNYRNLKRKDAKRWARLYDECDFIFSLYKRLQAKRFFEWSIHRLYVDEVQDFTQAELAVLFLCCRDPKGFFLTGDTAQSIVRGVAFRFEDVKTIFQDMKSKLNLNVEVPELYFLTVNHRSHAGVAALASSVTDLLKEYFPYSFDHKNVPKDRSLITGAKPVFLSTDENSLTRLLSETKGKGSTIEFGAHQAVIVRNKESKENLPNIIRNSAITLTIEESKGLEFDDVLVYNFFSDLDNDTSQIEVWQAAAAAYIEKRHESSSSFHHRLLKFLPTATHNKSLCADLKLLYTVVTRAKENLWFFESGPKKRYLPMLDYWEVRDLIEKISSPEPILHQYTKESTLEDWKLKGDVYSKQKRWMLAYHCYKKANEPLLAYKCMGVYHSNEARRTRDEECKIEEFKKAAILFLLCDEIDHDANHLQTAAMCLYHAHLYREAGKLFERMKKFEEFFWVSDALNDYKTCVKIKTDMGEYKGAIKYLISKGKSKEACKMVAKFVKQKLLDPDSFDITDTAYSCAQSSIRHGKTNHLHEIVGLLPNVNQRVEFLKQSRLFTEACQELLSDQQYDTTFRLYRAQGMWKKAILLAEEQTEFVSMCASLTLEKATAEIVQHNKAEEETLYQLKLLVESDDKDPATKAHASLLLARSYLYNETDTSYIYGKKALDIYQGLGGLEVGTFETFNMFVTYLEEQKLSSMEFLQLAAQRGIALKTTVQKLRTSIVFRQHVLQFYNLENSGTEMFCIPPNQDLWIKSLVECKVKGSKVQKYDSDGMLQLDSKKTVKAICDHLHQYADAWLIKSVNGNAQQIVSSKLQEFPFHEQNITKNFLTQSFRSCSKCECLNDYIAAFNLGLLLTKLGISNYDTEQMRHCVIKLFSFQMLLYLPLRLSQFASLETFATEVYRCLEERVEFVLNLSLEKKRKIVSTSEWLEVWRLTRVLGYSHTILENAIANIESRVTVAKSLSTDANYALPYDFIPLKGKPAHFFNIWLKCCKTIYQEGRVLHAVQEFGLRFIEVVANRPKVLLISLDDMVYIFSVFSVALFSLLAAHSVHRNTRSFFLPQTFFYMMCTFDELNSQQPLNTLIQACVVNITQDKKLRLVKVYDCLWSMVEILLGIYKEHFSVTDDSNRSCISSTQALHCVVLTLSIVGNMAFLFPGDMLNIYQKKCIQALQPLMALTNNDAELIILQKACISLANCTNTRELFCTVIHGLLSSKGFTLLELKAVSNPTTKILFQNVEYSPDRVPQLPLSPFSLTTDKTDMNLKLDVEKLKNHLSKLQKEQLEKQTSVSPLSVDDSENVEELEQTESQISSPEQNNESLSYQKSVESLQSEQKGSNYNHGLKTASVTTDLECELEEKQQIDSWDIDIESDHESESSSSQSIEYDEQDFDQELDEDMSEGGLCHICGIPTGSRREHREHVQTSNHITKTKDYEMFKNELEWQYRSSEPNLRDIINSSKSSYIGQQLHNLITEAEKMLRTNEKKIESIINSCNWSEGVSLISGMTDEADDFYACIEEQKKSDATAHQLDSIQSSAQDYDEDSVMDLSVEHTLQRQQSSEQHGQQSKKGSRRRNRRRKKN